MADSRQRRAMRRARSASQLPNRMLNRFRLFRLLAEHPKIAGGGGLMLAIYLAWEAFGKEVDGVPGTAALMFFIAWIVFCLAVYISDWWDTYRKIAIGVSVIVLFGMSMVWWLYLPISAGPPPRTEPRVAGAGRFKERREDDTKIGIVMGNNYLGGYPVGLLKKGARTLPIESECLDYNPIAIRVKDDEVLLSVIVWDGVNAAAVKIQDNEFTVKPDGWDRNSSNDALEIVDRDQNPVLQIYYASATVIVINGIFPCPKSVLYSDEKSLKMLAKGDRGQPLKRLFKYPGWKYKGQFDE
jgi:hypothetical protein